MRLQVSSHVLDPSSAYPFAVTAKRYRSPASPHAKDPEALTLVLAHATGMHKECFEPVLERLFELESLNVAPGHDRQGGLSRGSRNGIVKIREAWSIDCITHGEAGFLNETVLEDKFTEIFPWEEYGRTIGHFLSAGESRGAKVDFTTHNLCAIGHSFGAIAMLWLQASQEFPSVQFHSMLLMEPMLNPPGTTLASTSSTMFIPLTYTRRDVWADRETALKEFNESRGYKRWDRREISLFVDHALKPHPASRFSYMPFDGLTLACSKTHEAACYRGGRPMMYAMVDALEPISTSIPLHIIWAGVDDSVPRLVKEVLIDEYKTSVRFASVSYIPKVGHLMVQHAPVETANAIFDALKLQSSPPFTRAKL